MSHRTDIEAAVEAACPDMTDDERDDLLAVIYCWRAEQLTDLRRQMDPHLPQRMADHLGIGDR